MIGYIKYDCGPGKSNKTNPGKGKTPAVKETQQTKEASAKEQWCSTAIADECIVRDSRAINRLD